MIPDRLLGLLVAIIVIVSASVLALHGSFAKPGTYYDMFSYALSISTVFLVVWERYLWHCWPFYPYFHKRPDLRGTWKGRLDSNYIDPKTQERKLDLEVYLVIRQTFWTIDVRLFSAESSSICVSGSLFSDHVDIYTLACTYQSIPTVMHREKSPISYGGFLVAVRGFPAYQLDGEYWTDRKTFGQMQFTSRCKKQAHEYREAQRSEYSQC